MTRSLLKFCTATMMAAMAAGAAPVNDHFAAASVQTGSFWLTQGTLHGATSEANEPVITGFPNGPTAWWRWTATASGTVRVRTWGSEDRTIAAVYRGDTLDTTRLIAYGTSHFEITYSAEAIFTATAGETYSIQVLGADYASPQFIPNPSLPSRLQVSLTFSSGFAPVPLNDNFSAPLVLSGNTADVVISNAGAGAEPGEPLDLPDARGNTVWLSWTAPAAGVWEIDTQQGDHDTVTAVYTGSAVNALTRLDFSDDASPAAGSPYARGGRLAFRTTAGQNYRIQIQGASLPGEPLDYGNVRVQLQPVQPPPNDQFTAAAVLSGSSPAAGEWTTFATREPGEPAARTDESRSVWWRWTAPSSGLLAVIQYDGTVEPYTGSTTAALVKLPYAPNAGQRGSRGALTDWYAVTAGTVIQLRGSGGDGRVSFSVRMVQPPANDDFTGRKTLAGSTVTDTVNLEYASWETNEPLTDGLGPPTVWYRWVAPVAGKFVLSTQGSPAFTRLRTYTGAALNALTPAGTEQLYGYSPFAYGRVYLNTVSGAEYAIQLLRESAVTGTDRITIRPAAPPVNDAFASATLMTGSAWSASGSNVDATSESNEPFSSLSDSAAGQSVWWRWTAPAGGLFRLTTAGSSIDTVLVIYTGATLTGLTRTAQNQGSGWGSTGGLTFSAVQGTVYQFQVDGQARQEGALKLALSPVSAPPNNAFAGRLTLSGLSAAAGGTVLGATAEAGDPVIPGAATGRSVWYEWTAPASGTALFKVTAQRFNPAVGIFSGTSPASLSTLVTGGSGAVSNTEQTFLVGYPVSGGSSYKLLVDGAPAENGEFMVSVSIGAPPGNDAFAARSALSGAVVHASAANGGATKQTGEPSHAGSSANASVWWEWTAPAAGIVTMDTAGSQGQVRLAVYSGTALNALTTVASDTVVFPETYSSLNFTAAAGAKYIIAADSGDRSRGDISLTIVSGSAVAANDSFALATPWNTDAAESLVRPQGATAEAGEPAHGGRPAARSLWWAWRPLTTRRALVWMETESGTLPARFAVYKGSALNSLTELSAQTADAHWHRRTVDVLAGETYYLVLDTPSGPLDSGWIKLGVAPVNGTEENAAEIAAGSSLTAASMTGATNEDPSAAPTALRQLWWRWTPEINARMEWRVFAPADSGAASSVNSTSAFSPGGSGRAVPGSGELLTTFDAVAGTTYFLKAMTRTTGSVSAQLVQTERQAPPPNDYQYRAQPMAGASWSLPFTMGAETSDRQFWTWTATAAGVAEISLQGALAGDDALLAYADGGSAMTAGSSRTNGGPPVLRVASAQGQQWTIVSRTGLRRLRPAILSLTFPAHGTPPANDSWLSPEVLSSSWASAPGDVTRASCQPGERDHSASGGTQAATKLPPGRSVWYDWTPAASGYTTLHLESEAGLAMRIYRGGTQPEWREEGFLQPGSRALSGWFIAGETYHIAVAARPYEEWTSAFTLRRGAAAPNDLLSGAAVLTGPSASGSADSTGAGAEPGEPGHGFNFENPRASLWWKWTAPATGIVNMDTRGSGFDTILAVFNADPPDTTARVAENDNATGHPGVKASAVSFSAVAGQTYVIRLCRAETTEASGMAKLNLTMSAPPDPYARWLADWPALTAGSALETADSDGDGLRNLAELAFGSNPLIPDASTGALQISPAAGGWQVEARLDRDALDSLSGGTPLEVNWQLSRDLINWQPGPPSQFLRREGRFSVERISLQTGDPPFARILVRKPR